MHHFSSQPTTLLQTKNRQIHFPRRPLIMGIVNINDDSFCSDGSLDPSWALDHARQLINLGADIIDVGAESARTNREPIPASEEISRLTPFLKSFHRIISLASPRDSAQIFPPLLSINTWRPQVANAALTIAGDLLNDISGLPDPANAKIAASHQAALIIMHSQGEPKQKHTHVTYHDILATLHSFFTQKIQNALNAGLSPQSIILDPGIDFAKQAPDNLKIYHHLQRITSLGHPVLLPVSRKSVIGRTLGIPDPNQRDPGTCATIVAGTLRGACIFRVHNVEMAWRTLATLEHFRTKITPPLATTQTC